MAPRWLAYAGRRAETERNPYVAVHPSGRRPYGSDTTLPKDHFGGLPCYGAPRPLVERSWADIRRSHTRVLDEYLPRAEGHVLYSGNLGRPVAAIRARDLETEAAATQAEARGLEACGYDPAVRVRFQEEADIEAE